MSTFPTLETDRLVLTQLHAADIPLIVQYAGNPKVSDMTLNIPHPYAEEDAIYWINASNQGMKNGTQHTFAVRMRADRSFIGGIGLIVNQRFNRAEMGYWVAEPYWNQGFTSEAAGALLHYGFNTLGLQKIYATHLVENPASGRVMIKNGMIKEGELRDHMRKGDIYRSVVQYRLTREEYLQKD